jgi:hypothetical protein
VFVAASETPVVMSVHGRRFDVLPKPPSSGRGSVDLTHRLDAEQQLHRAQH